MEANGPSQSGLNSILFVKMNRFLGIFEVRKFVKLNCKNLTFNFSECSVSSFKQTAQMVVLVCLRFTFGALLQVRCLRNRLHV